MLRGPLSWPLGVRGPTEEGSGVVLAPRGEDEVNDGRVKVGEQLMGYGRLS